MLTLIIGGVRSGKSRFAASLCSQGSKVTYIATARECDDEMRSRIARHRRERPTEWATIEEPRFLARAVQEAASSDFVLIDCLTVWLGNLSLNQGDLIDQDLEATALSEIDQLHAQASRTHLIVVTNEVGCSVVPDTALGRSFRDLQGLINQRAAHAADAVYQTIAGIPMLLKPSPTREGNHS